MTDEPVATVTDLGKVEFHSVVPIGTRLYLREEQDNRKEALVKIGLAAFKAGWRDGDLADFVAQRLGD